MPSFRESSQPRDRTHVSHFAGGYFFYHLSHQGSLFFPVVIYRCEGWTIKKIESWRYFWAVVLEKTLENPFDCKEIKSVSPKGNQPWTFIGRTDAKAEAGAPTLWPLDVKSWLIGKDPDVGRDWRHTHFVSCVNLNMYISTLLDSFLIYNIPEYWVEFCVLHSKSLLVMYFIYGNVYMSNGLPRWLNGRESACNAGDVGLIPGSGRSPGEGNGSLYQCSCLGKPMDRGA